MIETINEENTVKTNTTVKSAIPPKVYEKKKVIFRTYQVIWYILGIIEILLAFRFVFKVIGASATSSFANLIYSLSDPLAIPFMGIIGNAAVSASVFEWSTLIAAVVYLLVAYGLVKLMQLIKPTSPEEVDETLDNT